MSNFNYAALIEKAITDFDAIFDILAQRGAIDTVGTHKWTAGSTDGYQLSTTEGATHGKRDGIKTEDYPALISQFVHVSGTNNYEPISYQSAGSLSTSSTTVSYGDGTITISGNPTTRGLYDTNSVISVTKSLTNVALSGNVSTLTSSNIDKTNSAYYVVHAGSGQILGNVTVNKAVITDSQPSVTSSLGATASLAIALDSHDAALNDLGSDFVLASAAGHASVSNEHDYFHVFLNATPTYSGSITANNTVSLTTPGYLDSYSASASNTVSVAATNGTIGEFVIDIAKGSLTNIGITATAALVKDSAIAWGTDSTDGYAITAQVSSASADASTGTFTSGYINNASAITFATPTSTSDVKYIKKGSLGNAASNATAVELEAGSIVKDTVNNKYTIDVSVKSGEMVSKEITDGYIPAANKTFEANISGSTTVDIAKGTATLSAGTAAFTKTDAKGILLTSASSGTDYAITVNSSADLTATKVTGYIEAADMNFASTASGSQTYYVKKGSVSLSTFSFAAAAHDVDAGNASNPDGTVSSTSIFLNSAPNSGDYYEVTLSGTAATAAGYVDGTESSSNTITKYIPKATFEYVETGSTADNYLQVKTGGFIDSGVIKNIASITGDPDYGTVGITLVNADVLKSSTDGTDYLISVQKDSATTDAGYVAGANGQGSVTGSAYVAHGSATISVSATDETVSNAPVFTAAANDNPAKYTFTRTIATSAVATLTKEGYIKIADITGTNSTLSGSTVTVSGSLNASFDVAKAVFAANTANDGNKVSIQRTGGTALAAGVSDVSYYTVSVGLDDTTIQAIGTTAGYFAVGDTQNLTVSADTLTLKIKAGTALTNVSAVDSAEVAANNPLTGAWDSTNSKYVVSLAAETISVSGTLTEGYYSSTNGTVTGTAAVTARHFDIAAAAASVSLSGTNSATLSGTIGGSSIGSALKGSGDLDNNKTYLALTPSASVTASASVGTAGYLQGAGQITGTGSQAITGTTQYIEVNGTTAVTLGSSSGENVVTSEILTVAGTYNNSAITITLNEDSMGTAVAGKLTQLQNRLNGIALSE